MKNSLILATVIAAAALAACGKKEEAPAPAPAPAVEAPAPAAPAPAEAAPAAPAADAAAPQRPPLTQLHLQRLLLKALLQTPPRRLPTLPPRKPPSSNPAFADGTGLGLCCEKTASFGLRFFRPPGPGHANPWFMHDGPDAKSHRQVNARWLQARAAALIPT
ncbi:hypothetical protein JQN63_08630 [Delftia lacustris]|uniref:hypothetical protein n=1 Tax=Delftia lacustris TaxID=558537 RepID=UPI00193C118F|nr:hypothetical protein [Delftia lacustris]QRI92070.1 hypothetical protein JQN63_08630 [Delftia lacustris]